MQGVREFIERIPQLHIVHFSEGNVFCWCGSGADYKDAVERFSRFTNQRYCILRRSAVFGERTFPEGRWNVEWSHVNRHKAGVVCVVPEGNMPLVPVPEVATLQCTFGPDNGVTAKKRYAAQRDAGQNTDHTKRRRQRRQVYSTRKVNCPARIVAKEVFVFVEYQVRIMVVKGNV